MLDLAACRLPSLAHVFGSEEAPLKLILNNVVASPYMIGLDWPASTSPVLCNYGPRCDFSRFLVEQAHNYLGSKSLRSGTLYIIAIVGLIFVAGHRWENNFLLTFSSALYEWTCEIPNRNLLRC